jgi:hypothetical protein
MGTNLSQIFLQIDKAVVERREHILRANRESIYCLLVQRVSPSSGPDVFTQASEVVRASAENPTPAVSRKCNALSAVQVCSLRTHSLKAPMQQNKQQQGWGCRGDGTVTVTVVRRGTPQDHQQQLARAAAARHQMRSRTRSAVQSRRARPRASPQHPVATGDAKAEEAMIKGVAIAALALVASVLRTNN